MTRDGPETLSVSKDSPSALTQRLRAHSSTAGIIAGLVTAVLLLSHFHLKYGLNSPPSATGDEPSYDSIGWQLAHGHGFSEDYGNADFRAPYDRAAIAHPDLMRLPEQLPGRVTYRPPLFPAVVSAFNALSGRQFYGTRFWNVLMVSATAALLVVLLLRISSVGAAAIGWCSFVVLDFRTRLYARAVLTEATALLLCTLAAFLLLRMLQRQRSRDAFAAGMILGLAILNRTATALWVPTIMCGLLCLLTWRPAGMASEDESSDDVRSSRMTLLTILLSTTLGVYLPWAVRNVSVLDAAMPLGAQGLIELPAGFSDQAWTNRGVWAAVPRTASRPSEQEPLTRPQLERARAEAGKATALSWIKANPGETVALGFLKVWQEYRPRTAVQVVLTVLALAGLFSTRRQPITHVFVVLHVANMLGIAATWSVEGRFVVPLLFTVHVWAALGATWLLTVFSSTRRSTPHESVPAMNVDPDSRTSRAQKTSTKRR
jgi:hypothetical protein